MKGLEYGRENKVEQSKIKAEISYDTEAERLLHSTKAELDDCADEIVGGLEGKKKEEEKRQQEQICNEIDSFFVNNPNPDQRKIDAFYEKNFERIEETVNGYHVVGYFPKGQKIDRMSVFFPGNQEKAEWLRDGKNSANDPKIKSFEKNGVRHNLKQSFMEKIKQNPSQGFVVFDGKEQFYQNGYKRYEGLNYGMFAGSMNEMLRRHRSSVSVNRSMKYDLAFHSGAVYAAKPLLQEMKSVYQKTGEKNFGIDSMTFLDAMYENPLDVNGFPILYAASRGLVKKIDVRSVNDGGTQTYTNALQQELQKPYAKDMPITVTNIQNRTQALIDSQLQQSQKKQLAKVSSLNHEYSVIDYFEGMNS